MNEQFSPDDLDFSFLENICQLFQIASGEHSENVGIFTIHQGDEQEGFTKGYIIAVDPKNLKRSTQLQLEALIARLTEE